MGNCCICGNKISLLKGGIDITFNNEKYEICDVCNAQRVKLHNDNLDVVKSAANYFMDFKEKDLPANVINLIESYISIANSRIYGDKYREQEKKKMEEKRTVRNQLYKSMKLTSGYNFEGYRIVKYCDVLSSSVVMGTGMFSELEASITDMFGTKSREFSQKIEKAKQDAKEQLMNQSANIGGNAIIGLDYNVFSLAANMIAVTAHGTAVLIEETGESDNDI